MSHVNQQFPPIPTEKATECYRKLEQLDTDNRLYFDELFTILDSNTPNSKILLKIYKWATKTRSCINYDIHRVLDILEPYSDLPENYDNHPFQS